MNRFRKRGFRHSLNPSGRASENLAFSTSELPALQSDAKIARTGGRLIIRRQTDCNYSDLRDLIDMIYCIEKMGNVCPKQN